MDNEYWFVARHVEAAVSFCSARGMNSWGFQTLEIPEWMFDSCVGGRMKAVDFPQVECSALLALKCLLSAATGSSELDVVQAQYHSASSRDSDAQAVAVQMQSRRVVFSTGEVPPSYQQSAPKMTRLLATMLNEHVEPLQSRKSGTTENPSHSSAAFTRLYRSS